MNNLVFLGKLYSVYIPRQPFSHFPEMTWENKFESFLRGKIQQKGFTRIYATGHWKGKIEPVIAYQFTIDQSVDPETMLHKIVDYIFHTTDEEAIFYTRGEQAFIIHREETG